MQVIDSALAKRHGSSTPTPLMEAYAHFRLDQGGPGPLTEDRQKPRCRLCRPRGLSGRITPGRNARNA